MGLENNSNVLGLRNLLRAPLSAIASGSRSSRGAMYALMLLALSGGCNSAAPEQIDTGKEAHKPIPLAVKPPPLPDTPSPIASTATHRKRTEPVETEEDSLVDTSPSTPHSNSEAEAAEQTIEPTPESPPPPALLPVPLPEQHSKAFSDLLAKHPNVKKAQELLNEAQQEHRQAQEEHRSSIEAKEKLGATGTPYEKLHAKAAVRSAAKKVDAAAKNIQSAYRALLEALQALSKQPHENPIQEYAIWSRMGSAAMHCGDTQAIHAATSHLGSRFSCNAIEMEWQALQHVLKLEHIDMEQKGLALIAFADNAVEAKELTIAAQASGNIPNVQRLSGHRKSIAKGLPVITETWNNIQNGNGHEEYENLTKEQQYQIELARYFDTRHQTQRAITCLRGLPGELGELARLEKKSPKTSEDAQRLAMLWGYKGPVFEKVLSYDTCRQQEELFLRMAQQLTDASK